MARRSNGRLKNIEFSEKLEALDSEATHFGYQSDWVSSRDTVNGQDQAAALSAAALIASMLAR
ncbi:hypothetical protein [Mesorhizobium sp.]|uniref:hypothetical protein n=1 Tax=Mesorhizobium sp. TaxID=1871066 RepID=UPI0025E14335|nr:hypothetical protein [Mesorhizobium sp.]